MLRESCKLQRYLISRFDPDWVSCVKPSSHDQNEAAIFSYQSLFLTGGLESWLGQMHWHHVVLGCDDVMFWRCEDWN